MEELRSRVFATNPCNAKRFISHAEGEQLQEGALAGLQAGGRRGHGPLGVLPKCFDDRADERGGGGPKRVAQDPMVDGLAHCLRSPFLPRGCAGAAVKALLCRRFLTGLPGVPPEQLQSFCANMPAIDCICESRGCRVLHEERQ